MAFALAAAELFRGEAVDGAVKLVVAKQTLGAAGKVPGQFTASAGDVFISHEQLVGGDEHVELAVLTVQILLVPVSYRATFVTFVRFVRSSDS